MSDLREADETQIKRTLYLAASNSPSPDPGAEFIDADSLHYLVGGAPPVRQQTPDLSAHGRTVRRGVLRSVPSDINVAEV